MQECWDAGSNILGESKCVSPAFVVVNPKKGDDPEVDNLRFYLEKGNSSRS